MANLQNEFIENEEANTMPNQIPNETVVYQYRGKEKHISQESLAKIVEATNFFIDCLDGKPTEIPEPDWTLPTGVYYGTVAEFYYKDENTYNESVVATIILSSTKLFKTKMMANSILNPWILAVARFSQEPSFKGNLQEILGCPLKFEVICSKSGFTSVRRLNFTTKDEFSKMFMAGGYEREVL